MASQLWQYSRASFAPASTAQSADSCWPTLAESLSGLVEVPEPVELKAAGMEVLAGSDDTLACVRCLSASSARNGTGAQRVSTMGFDSYRAIFEKNCTLAAGLASLPWRPLATGRSASVKDLAAKLVGSKTRR